jgi:hypothetical protein
MVPLLTPYVKPLGHPAKLGRLHQNRKARGESGVIEIVTSGVAHRGRGPGVVRKNYAALTFESAALQVKLRCLKAGSRFRFGIPLAARQLP